MVPLLRAISLFTLIACVRPTHAQTDQEGAVVIHADARLAVLVRKNHSYVRLSTPEPPKPAEIAARPAPGTTTIGPSGLVHHDMRTTYSGKGFRVQIYNGPSREKALAAKTAFMRHNPGVSSYIMYIAPGFRVKVGDFRFRHEAEGMLRVANSMFSPSMIVPDEVTVSGY